MKRIYKVVIDYSNSFEFDSWGDAERFIKNAVTHSTKKDLKLTVSAYMVEEENNESDAETDEA